MIEPYYADESVTLYHGDCLDLLPTLPDCSVDAVVTDPPYGLEFMGREWDAPWQSGAGIGGHTARFSEKRYKDGSTAQIPSYMGGTNPTCRNCGGLRNGRDGKKGQPPCRCDDPRFDNVTLPRMLAYGEWCRLWAAECLRVLKPGGHLLAFGGTRTYHRLTCAIEDAGFEVRDCIMWVYGSGFPKSLDVSKAIDKAAGAEREVIGERSYGDGHVQRSKAPRFNGDAYAGGGVYSEAEVRPLTAPATDDAKRWAGWGTALKPSHEPIVVARKPLAGTVAANVVAYGTGALNIDACRVAHASEADLATSQAKNPGRIDLVTSDTYGAARPQQSVNTDGRWPTNVVLSHGEACVDECANGCPVAELDRQSGVSLSAGGSGSRSGFIGAGGIYNGGWGQAPDGGANAGGLGDSGGASRFFPTFRYEPKAPTSERPRVDGQAHETVKPLDLMRWLVRLVTPPGGLVLDPFAGSGTTAEACVLEGFRCVAVERGAKYLPLIVARLTKPLQPALTLATDVWAV